MSDRELIMTIEIPRYRRNFVASEHIREIYYEKGKKQLPKNVCDPHMLKTQDMRVPNNTTHFWRQFPVVRQKVRKMVDFLVDDTGKRIIANTNDVGKQRVVNINGQKIYNGFVSKHQRNLMIGTIKDQFRQFAAANPEIKVYPLIIECHLYDTIIDTIYAHDKDWDVGNRVMPYNKAFEDTLKSGDLGIIKDDSAWYVTGAPGGLFFPVEDPEDRKLVYYIYHDKRDIVQKNVHYIKKLKL